MVIALRAIKTQTSLLKFGVDELVADSIALPASNGIIIYHLKGGESSSQFQWFTIAKTEL